MHALSSTNAASCSPLMPVQLRAALARTDDHADSGEGSISDWSLEPRPLASHSLRSRSKRARSAGT